MTVCCAVVLWGQLCVCVCEGGWGRCECLQALTTPFASAHAAKVLLLGELCKHGLSAAAPCLGGGSAQGTGSPGWWWGQLAWQSACSESFFGLGGLLNVSVDQCHFLPVHRRGSVVGTCTSNHSNLQKKAKLLQSEPCLLADEAKPR